MIILTQMVIVKGDVVDDLDFRLAQLGRGPIAPKRKTRPDGRVELHFEGKHVVFPGQANLLSWQPRVTTEAPR
jgi:hypothetical protein